MLNNRYAMALLIFAVTGLCTGLCQAQSERLPAGAELRQQLSELVLDYAFYRDRLEAEAVADLFTIDAQLIVLGQVFNGQQAIHQRIADSRRTGQGPATRHLMSTMRFFKHTADQASGISYVTVLGAEGRQLPMQIEGFLAVGEYHDQFVRTPQGWKIARREFVPVFNYLDQP